MTPAIITSIRDRWPRILLGNPSDPAAADCLARAYLGLGQLDVMPHPSEARAHLQRAVGLAELVEAAVPSRGNARRGLIEANFQLGRAHSFAFDFSKAEEAFRKSRDLANQWLSDEPLNPQASDLLGSCYRKLADMRKFAKDYDGARELYVDAISIGERLMTTEPGNSEFQEHLATALHDLAGVLLKIDQADEARGLLQRAEKVCSRLITTDPESVESQARLVLVLTDLGRIARNESNFASASQCFQRAGEVLRGLMSRVSLEAWPGLDSGYLENLRVDEEECRDGPLALGDLGAIRSRPVNDAIRLLKTRAHLLTARRRWAELVKTVVALRDLEPKLAADLYAQARVLALCLGYLDDNSIASVPAKDRQDLRQSCIERSLVALNQAAALGFRDVSGIDTDETFAPLRPHAGYAELISRLSHEPSPVFGEVQRNRP